MDQANASTARDNPPHLPDDSIFEAPKLEISDELIPVFNPIFEEDIPEHLTLAFCKTENIPGLFALRQVNQMAAKARIIKALELASSYLCHSKLRQSVQLSQSILKKPRIHEVSTLLENLSEEFRTLHDFVDVKALSPKPEVLASIAKKLSNLREEA
jgi:hypothetical protein